MPFYEYLLFLFEHLCTIVFRSKNSSMNDKKNKKEKIKAPENKRYQDLCSLAMCIYPRERTKLSFIMRMLICTKSCIFQTWNPHCFLLYTISYSQCLKTLRNQEESLNDCLSLDFSLIYIRVLPCLAINKLHFSSESETPKQGAIVKSFYDLTVGWK